MTDQNRPRMRARVERIYELAALSTDCTACHQVAALARETLRPPPEFDEA